MVERYAAGEGSEEDGGGKAFVSLNWLLSEEHLDLETELAWGFLDYLLLGTSAAPLRKALNDSGLGEALIGACLGLSQYSLQHCIEVSVVLDNLLLGTSAAPLRNALNDSSLSEALIGAKPCPAALLLLIREILRFPTAEVLSMQAAQEDSGAICCCMSLAHGDCSARNHSNSSWAACITTFLSGRLKDLWILFGKPTYVTYVQAEAWATS